MNIYQLKKPSNKATKDNWFRNGVRTDLNTLITKTTKQNELIEQLIRKVGVLSSERRI